MTRRDKEQYLFGSIFILANRFQAEGDKLADELSLKQWFLLLILLKHGAENPSVQDLADALGSTRQNTKKMVDLLDKKGFIHKERSKKDSRAWNIKPTEKAVQFFLDHKTLGYDLLDASFEGISEEELTITYQVFQKLSANLNGRTGGGER